MKRYIFNDFQEEDARLEANEALNKDKSATFIK